MLDSWLQLLATLLGGGALGAIVKTSWENVKHSRTTKAEERRREIDRANAAERDVRIYKESLAITRRIIIDAPCLGHEYLPEWPSTSSTRRPRDD